MQDNLPILKADMDKLFRLLPSDEAQRTLSLIDALNVFRTASDKKRCAAEMALRLEPLGYKGLSLQNLYRKCAQVFIVDDKGKIVLNLWGAVDARVARRITSQGIAANTELVQEWQRRVLSCRRKVKPAWRGLIADLVNNVKIPGVGTWRELYFEKYGYSPSGDEICPWSELNPPPGWSLRNLASLKPDKFALAAARVGMGKAKIDFLPTVKMTRVGLLPCQVVEVDDMWYEHSVIFGRNTKPQRVVEFAAMDRLTGHVICHLAKPIIEGDDGKRKTLKSAWVRYLYHYVLCVVGVPEEGCVIKGEHGTAAMDDTFDAALNAINAVRTGEGKKPIAFRAGSIITEPIAKGMANVQHHGNPRHKGMIEQMHATLKNYADELIFGNIGGGRGIMPEETLGLIKEDAQLMRLATALKPGAVDKLKFNFPTWGAFAMAAEEAHRKMDERKDHQLEGWEECGFMVGELKVANSSHWGTMPALRHLPQAQANKVNAMVAAGLAEYRERRMSPAEAWRFSTNENQLEKVSAGFAPMILGKELAHLGMVNDKLMVTVRDADTGEKYTVAAIIDGRPLERGQKVLVWVNPMDCGKAYVADLQGRFLGVASVMAAARADADASVSELQEQLGLRSAALADERKRLEPHVKARLKERADAAAANVAALGLEDPVEIAETEKRKAIELKEAAAADVQLEADEVQVDAPTAEVTLDPTDEPEEPRVDFEHFDFD